MILLNIITYSNISYISFTQLCILHKSSKTKFTRWLTRRWFQKAGETFGSRPFWIKQWVNKSNFCLISLWHTGRGVLENSWKTFRKFSKTLPSKKIALKKPLFSKVVCHRLVTLLRKGLQPIWLPENFENFRETFTAWNTQISPNFLVWKFCGNA